MVKLEIVLQDDGNIGLSGPLQNKLLCLGLLEAAKDVVKAYQPSPIVQGGQVQDQNGKPVNLRRVQ